MPSLKEVRIRIQSVNSTQQITKAMKMVAAAKLRKSQDAIIQLRPYSKKLGEILNNISSAGEIEVESPLLKERPADKVLIVVITSDRGLCGAFNSNATKATLNLINEQYSAQQKAGNLTVLTIGKKGQDFFVKRGFNVVSEFTGIFTQLSFAKVKEAAEHIINAYTTQQYDRVELVYNEFKNVATQILRKETFLPLQKLGGFETVEPNNNFIMEPSPEAIIEEIIPKSLKIQLFKAVLESNASEHGARMTAMDKATENAGELLKELKLQYNRGRQAAITKEILEIVGGAEALSNG